jgi:4-hydroxy-2-oxoheptanedioate aldolase
MAGGTRFGGWAIMADRVAMEAICRSGVDFVGVDAQHGFFGFESAAVAVQVANLCGVHCLVRLPVEHLGWAPRYLDAGADGVVVAMVRSAEEAADAVELCRYQVAGRRSYGGGRRNGVGDMVAGDDGAPPAPEVYAMVETGEALGALDDLARVPGLTGLYVGPVDLGLALGVPEGSPESGYGPWRGAVQAVVEACQRHGRRSGTFATDGDDGFRWAAYGFTDVVLSSDIAMLRRALRDDLHRARGDGPAQGPPAAADAGRA